jgi:flavin-dependent dehydrogenase
MTCLVRVVTLSIPPPPEGTPIPRVSTRAKIVGAVKIDGMEIPLRKITYGDIENLPDEKEGTIYVFSTLVTLALKEKGVKRGDLLSPDTNADSVVRDRDGTVLGVKYLQTLW